MQEEVEKAASLAVAGFEDASYHSREAVRATLFVKLSELVNSKAPPRAEVRRGARTTGRTLGQLCPCSVPDLTQRLRRGR